MEILNLRYIRYNRSTIFMIHLRSAALFLLIPLAVLLLFSCSTVEPGTSGSATVEAEPEGEPSFSYPLVYGRGSGETENSAVNAALLDGARKTAESLVGPAQVVCAQDKFEALFVRDASAGRSFYRDGSIEILGLDKSSENPGEILAVTRGRINTPYLIEQIQAVGIGRQLAADGAAISGLEDEAVPSWAEKFMVSSAAAVDTAEKVESLDLGSSAMKGAKAVVPERLDLTPEERQRLTDYLTGMKFMVVPSISPEDSKAVSALNQMLEMRGYTVSSPTGIDTILQDQEKPYIEETGEQIGKLEWAADKLRADVCLVLESRTRTFASQGNYSAEGSLNIRVIVVRNWKELGTLSSPRGVAVSGYDSAEKAAFAVLVRGLTEMLPELAETAEKGVRDMLLKGIPYTVRILNLDARGVVNDLVRSLKPVVRGISTEIDGGSAVLMIRYLGGVESLENSIYDAAESIPRLTGMTLLNQRGNELTFDAPITLGIE